ncbi:MAG: SUMF1/EgtB/PvdO family nonheme iron enzyme, partial [Rhodopirellula sp.]|nr:SUMF1/EgtB/PvdO family nonheme iron enzyme [Rhodopirellula sp.]
ARCCEWLSSQHPDMTFSLPTEAQWEFACRAGTKSSLYDCENSEQLRQYAQFGDEVHFIQRGGQLRPNAFGLYDTLGNVSEWCLNWLAGYASSPTDDPAGPAAPGKYAWRAIRGGSFIAKVWRVRSSKRDFYPPDDCFFDRGFRVAAAITNDADRGQQAAKATAPTNVADASTSQMTADAPPSAIAPFNAEQAKTHQETWATYLDIPVEYENSLGMKFRLIPPGEFLMGSTLEEIEAASPVPGKRDEWSEFVASESPQHRVILTRPIYLGTTEVTQEQYQQIIGDNPSLFSSEGKGKESEAVANLETRNFPVEQVSWYDAVAFCTKLSQREQLAAFDHQRGSNVRPMEATGYRLPTEAEWEFACRAGTGTQITGDKKSKALLETCWFAANSDGRTHAVGELQANPLGLLDMQGNVWEWVQDSWDSSFYDSFSDQPAIDPCRPIQSESLQVIRGGYWRDRPTFCRPSCRYANTPDHRYGIGFRVALSVDAVKQPPNAKAVTTALPPFTDADVARIAALPAEQQVEEVRRELKRRNPNFDPATLQSTIEDGVVVALSVAGGWTQHSSGIVGDVTDISPVRALTGLKSLRCGASWWSDHNYGVHDSLPDCSLTDLSPLQGLKLTTLDCDGSDVADLSPLRGMPLEHLVLAGSQVSDLSPIDPLRLKSLNLGKTRVTDASLTHFKGCTNLTSLTLAENPVTDAGLACFKECKNLNNLNIHQTNVTDLSVLKGLPLKELLSVFQPDRDTEILRSIKTLETINHQSTTEFWKSVEADKR